jgi:hypothetical protein
MGGRYLISGAQIGTLIGLLKNNQEDLIFEELDYIAKYQFLGNSDKTVITDIIKLSKKFKNDL